MILYYFFLAANFSSKLENKCEFFFFFLLVCDKTTFLLKDKDHTLIYRRLTGFIMSFAYLGFLDIRLSLGPSFLPIPLVLRYKVTSRSRFYQTRFLVF